MPKTLFETLRVYQEAEILSDQLWQEVIRWNYFEKRTIGMQLVRCADSVGANLAEGYGRESIAERKRFALIAQGSLYEVKYWLKRADIREIADKNDLAKYILQIEQLMRQHAAYLKYLTRQKATAKAKK